VCPRVGFLVGNPPRDLLVAAGATFGSWEAARVAAGRPAADVDFCAAVSAGSEGQGAAAVSAGPAWDASGKELDLTPLELGLFKSVHFDKGCYLGQEILAKVGNLDAVRRALVGLELMDSSVQPGAGLILEGDPSKAVVGRVTSVTSVAQGGGALGLGLGLAVVKRKVFDRGPGVRLVCAGAAEAVFVTRDLPFATRTVSEAAAPPPRKGGGGALGAAPPVPGAGVPSISEDEGGAGRLRSAKLAAMKAKMDAFMESKKKKAPSPPPPPQASDDNVTNETEQEVARKEEKLKAMQAKVGALMKAKKPPQTPK